MGLSQDEIDIILKSNLHTKKQYTKDETVALEGNICSNLGLILEGEIEISKNYPSGNKLIINTFTSGNVFGESILFSDINTYPADVHSTNNTSILFIRKDNLVKLFSEHPIILDNFLKILSNRIVMLSGRIELLSHSSIKEKISSFLLEEYKKQATLNLTFEYTRKKMAEILNIPRPSLSRELNNMKNDKIIDLNKNKIKILDLELLENIIIEGP